ncbi:twin-arginine translocation signal domain-containing protein [Halobacterium yunchengense]|uniref:twin-arginine translocation signal domain-containing protein n=1 Tax=Halobacterium yunchengense TaxID=3108497 RepID=UPI003009E745
MAPTRRQFLLTATGALTALAGCSAFSDPERPILVAVDNYSDSPHQGSVLVETDGTELVHQYVEVGPAEPDGWTTVETKLDPGDLPSGTPLDVTASFGDGLRATGQHALDCTPEYSGRAIYVQIEHETPVNVRLNLACYDDFPSNEAEQGGIDQP